MDGPIQPQDCLASVFTTLLNCCLNFEQGLQRTNTGKKELSQPSLALCCGQIPACCNRTQILNSFQPSGYKAVFDILHKLNPNFSNTSSPPKIPLCGPHRRLWLRDPSLKSSLKKAKKLAIV